MLIAHSVTRTDGTWFFSDNHYVGSLATELYSNQLPQNIHEENETSNDIRRSFLKKDGTNPLLKKIRDNFEASGAPAEIEGILRVHLELRRVLGLDQLPTSKRTQLPAPRIHPQYTQVRKKYLLYTKLLVVHDEAQILDDAFNGSFVSVTSGDSQRTLLSPDLHGFQDVEQSQLTLVTCGTSTGVNTISWVEGAGSGV
ncbi:hypothetical protein BG011_007425 [Mortierella polycephala]|uniref:Uncharacterized protein n=1 Tax=Mortierella polycephala TaxID=41804 RepID=A0A9P6PTK1_9FUNG|nr:hypothetical protein BG011_007425 [Mortierella polycephala]